MRVLAIDTSNQTMSVAVTEDAQIIGECTTHVKRNHSERLMPAIHHLMKEVGWNPETLDRIVVAEGPGSYTGLRIGVTVAKTLSTVLEKDLVPVSSLEVLAANRVGTPHYIVPFFDARRGNIYTGLYQTEGTTVVSVLPDRHISMEEWVKELGQLEGCFEFISPDHHLYQMMLKKDFGERYISVPAADQLPRAAVLALLGETKQPVEAHTFTPTYLKLAEAEENWQKQHPDEVGGEYIEKY